LKVWHDTTTANNRQQPPTTANNRQQPPTTTANNDKRGTQLILNNLPFLFNSATTMRENPENTTLHL
jgi:hypothetical protein